MNRRVVVTGLGVVSPIGNTVREFSQALREGRSGIRHMPVMAEHNFGCQVAGVPEGVDEIAEARFAPDELMAMNSSHRFGAVAALDAWADAGLERPAHEDDRVNWESGAIIGTGVGGLDTIGEKVVPLTNAGKVRRLGSTCVEQVMASGISARVSGLLALGNQVSSNSSACSTGAEAIVTGMWRIRNGLAERMLCGGSEGASHYAWAGFDAMRVLSRPFNERPEEASRPLSASAAGFVPAAGAGLLLLESLDSALARGARIYAEMRGGFLNCGGHRMGGSMTAPNPVSVRRCISGALADAGVHASEVDAINGHLTATGADPAEVRAWAEALDRQPGGLPTLTATKSLIGHALGAAGGIESVACVLMLAEAFLHPCRNSEDVHPEIEAWAAAIPHTTQETPELRHLIKAGFGFGDVNACLVFSKWTEER